MQESCIRTCAINWIILTKILRGMSLGTTLRLPLGNRVEVMDVRRLGEEGERQAEREENNISVKFLHVLVCNNKLFPHQ